MAYTPIIVGAAQFTQAGDVQTPLDPMGLMEKTGAMALSQAGTGLASSVDCVWVSNILSWGYADAPGLLARRLGLVPKHTHYSIMSGHTPQAFVNQASRAISRGEVRAVLMAGGEAQSTVKRSYKGKVQTQWPGRENPSIVGDGAPPDLGANSLENRHQFMIPLNMYALMETALRARLGVKPNEHLASLGRLFSRFSHVAANHSHAWNQTAYTPEEIVTSGPHNPMACHPYTRLMTANMNVDMSAALVMTSEEHARDLGLDSAGWVYPMGGSDLENIYHVTRRPRLDNSPALGHAARLALAQSGLDIKDIEAFDLYSCFPVMVEIALRELEISDQDPRPFTVTGGLPFFGGPMGNYSMHAIVTGVEKLRKGTFSNAMVTANGGFNTRHSVGVYGKQPPAAGWDSRDDSALQQEILGAALPPPLEKAHGELVVEGYIIRNSKQGTPESGVILGRLENGVKTLAALDAEPEALAYFVDNELVGRGGTVRYASEPGCNLVTIH